MGKEMSRKSKHRMQLFATVLGCTSIIIMMWENFRWWDNIFVGVFGLVYYVALTVGSALLTVYYKTDQKTFWVKAHVILLVGFIVRFFDIAVQCLFSGDVPGYSIVLFGLLPGFSVLSEVVILVMLKNKKADFWKKTVLINCLIQIVFWGLAILFGILDSFTSIYMMIESLSGLYGVTLFITYINIGMDCIKEEIDYLG